jgi:integrase
MSIFKRGKVYWYHFVFNGEHIQRSTKQKNAAAARQIEAAYKTALAKGEVGIIEKKQAPKLKDFAQKFIDAVQMRCKPRTLDYYGEKMKRLLEYDPVANSKLDKIEEALIEEYVQQRRQQKSRRKTLISVASVNRELAVLRHALNLAHEWKIINRVPKFRMLSGEKPREFVLTHEKERLYLEKASQPLHDLAMLALDTGLRIGEALALTKDDIALESVNGAKFGLLRVRDGKSENAKRILLLTERVQMMLKARVEANGSLWIFPDRTGEKPYLDTSIEHQHKKLRRQLQLPEEAVVHSFRHTFLTRLGESGVDVFSIMKIAGHSSVKVSEKYVHPSSESVERAFARLQEFNETALKQLPATVPATSVDIGAETSVVDEQQSSYNQ